MGEIQSKNQQKKKPQKNPPSTQIPVKGKGNFLLQITYQLQASPIRRTVR